MKKVRITIWPFYYPEVRKMKISFMAMISQLSGGMLGTVGIFFATLLFSLPLGLLVSFGRMSKIKIIQWITKVYISIMRGTPLMLQLMEMCIRDRNILSHRSICTGAAISGRSCCRHLMRLWPTRLWWRRMSGGRRNTVRAIWNLPAL